MQRMLTRCAAAILLMAISGTTADASIFLSLDPQGGVNLSSLAIGQTFTVAIDMSGLTSTEELTTLTIGESFSSALRINSTSAGDLITNNVSFTSSNTTSSFTFSLAASPPITTSGSLELISFTALQAGQATFRNYSINFMGAASPLLFNLNVPYSIAPEPASLVLCGIACTVGLSVALIRRRRVVG